MPGLIATTLDGYVDLRAGGELQRSSIGEEDGGVWPWNRGGGWAPGDAGLPGKSTADTLANYREDVHAVGSLGRHVGCAVIRPDGSRYLARVMPDPLAQQ